MLREDELASVFELQGQVAAKHCCLPLTFLPALMASSRLKACPPGGRTTLCTRAVGRSGILLVFGFFEDFVGAALPSVLGRLVSLPSSSVHLVNSNILRSRGSPMISPFTRLRPWHVASACTRGVFASAAPMIGTFSTSSWSSENFLLVRSTLRIPRTSSPSSVRVPVLSKQTRLTFPPTLTRLGEMQKMSFLRSLRIAKDVPIDIVAGSAGGTTIVTRSRARMTIVCHLICRSKVSDQSCMLTETRSKALSRETYPKRDKIEGTAKEP